VLITLDFQKTIEKRLREKSPLLQILLGPRQVGKTTAAKCILKEWPGPKLMISADSPSPPNADWIRFHWEQARKQGPKTLFIIDEVQKVPGWSEQVKLLFDQDRGEGRLKILLLGSSGLYLQKGLGESLAGRFELIKAPHWSFQEFHKAFGWDMETYFRFGAYPGAVDFKNDEERWRRYILEGIIEPVLSKDILGLHPVRKPALFRQTFELTVQLPAHIISLQKLLGQLQDRGNATTIRDYLNLFEKSFLIKALQKYSGSVLRTRASSPKILVLNPALIHAYQSQARLNQDPQWYGYVFESLLGAHLFRVPNSELYYWREGNVEVDFILKTPKGLWALEIKSGRKKPYTKGLQEFSKKFPKANCETWDFDRCMRFLRGEQAF